MSRLFVLLLSSAFAFGATSGLAHHSGSMFESEKTVTLTGVVKQFQYTNPHSWLIVTVTNDDGTTSTWGFEAEGPSRLQLAGIKPGDFKPGTEITITGRPMRDGRPAAFWVKAVRHVDGKEFVPADEKLAVQKALAGD
jgi:hypothetical protein